MVPCPGLIGAALRFWLWGGAFETISLGRWSCGLPKTILKSGLRGVVKLCPPVVVLWGCRVLEGAKVVGCAVVVITGLRPPPWCGLRVTAMGRGVVLMIGLNSPYVTVGGVGVDPLCLRWFTLGNLKPALVGRRVVVIMGLKPLIVDEDWETATLGRSGRVVFRFRNPDLCGDTFKKRLVAGLLTSPL